MNFYVNLPTKKNMDNFHKCCAQFEAGIMLEYIKSLDMSNHEKKQILEGVLDYLKANPR